MKPPDEASVGRAAARQDAEANLARASARQEQEIDPALAAMSGTAAMPRRNGELVFEAPWEGRAFGMALGVVRGLGLEWTAFQQRLIDEIAARPEAPYYECWLAALERLVLEQGVLTTHDLDRAAIAVARDAERE